MKDTDLYGVAQDEYGERYQEHFLALFKGFVGSADTVSARRHTANNWFLLLNSTVIGLVGYLTLGEDDPPPLAYSTAAALGMAFCYTWYHLIESYKTLNAAKFAVINKMEECLPVKTYTAEWQKLQTLSHNTFSSLEKHVPFGFFLVHLGVFLYGLGLFLYGIW